MHGPLHSLRKLVNQSHVDSPIDYSPILKFPDEVGLCTSSLPGIEYGVCAKAAIPSGTWIGPYEGRLVRPEQIKRSTETEFMWEVRDMTNCHYPMKARAAGVELSVCLSFFLSTARGSGYKAFFVRDKGLETSLKLVRLRQRDNMR